ncbi:MAG TPA: 3-isopropylmalate dehydratase large subunit [Syntrophomonadaceae bacterium]|nr:3-isopropylmalate dehydratase large subunit [Syntrophomonadaceae bacterium]HRX21662.1 3-isopropylmalate dehydratase large subunit [Syntrophomonadaceae bacterium]
MGKTIAEKILSQKSVRDAKANDIVIADLDFVMGQDGTSPLAIKAFQEMQASKVFDPARIAMVIDHSAPSPLEGVSELHRQMRVFAREQQINFYDIGDGVCHQLVPEQGHVVPGDLVIGADSHTCTYGAINALSTGVGSTDLAAGIISGKLWFKVPETFKFILNGKLGEGVYSKDLILFLIGEVTADGATYMAAEYCGEAISDLSVDARFTISNMAIEMGAKCGLMEADDKTIEWVKKHSRKEFVPVSADADAVYAKVKEYDVSSLEPQIARPHTVDNVVGISQLGEVPIQQGVIGTCTNGRMEDLRIAARILKGRKINKEARLIVAPASRQIMIEAMREGLIETFIQAGAAVVTPGCGPCVGTHNGVPSDGENVISTANRNFKGRMGNNKAFIYLGSPATVAASVINGRITDPRQLLS